MNTLNRLATAGTALIASVVMVWPVARTVALAPARQFPGLPAEATSVAIALSTWALVFVLAIWVVLRVPKWWHISARAITMFAVVCVLLTAGALALLVPFSLLNFICVTASVCKVSVLAEALNQAFTRHALHSPYPELVLVVPFVIGVAVALRNPFRPGAQRGGGRHAA